MRAKEMERRQQLLSVTEVSAIQENARYHSEDNNVSEAKTKEPGVGETEERPVVPYNPREEIASQRQQRITELQSLNEKEEKVLGSMSPLDPNLLCESIHQYICTTSNFLNTFVADVDASLEGTDRKLRVLEDQMAMLEGRLASIPGLLDDENKKEANNRKDLDNAKEGEG
jgi:chaperonin cofactor prefoldin